VPGHADSPDDEQVDILEFLLSGETYAIETSFIAETFPLVDFAPLFCTPPFVMGIINVRGRIVSIVDMRRFFDLPVAGLSNLNRVIVVRDGKMEFGILADSIIGMRSLPRRDLQASLPTLTGIREEFLVGVTADRLVLLDMGKILADRRLVVHEEVE
jgi:purine-binding chemotaxis protein CheW